MVTVDLTQLDGAWKPYFTRRLALLKSADDTLVGLWQDLRPNFTRIVTDARSTAGLAYETLTPLDSTVSAALVAAVKQVITDVEIVAALAVHMAQAEAEGVAGALGLAAHAAGGIGFNFDLAFQDAYDALGHLEAINAQALATLGSVGDSTVKDLGKVLQQAIADGIPLTDTLDLLAAEWDDAEALSYWADVVMSASMSQGALDLYAAEGVLTVNWVTAGDRRVCADCESNEESNPWPADSMPVPPQHGRCRCVLTANDSLPSSSWAAYVTNGASDE